MIPNRVKKLDRIEYWWYFGEMNKYYEKYSVALLESNRRDRGIAGAWLNGNPIRPRSMSFCLECLVWAL